MSTKRPLDVHSSPLLEGPSRKRLHYSRSAPTTPAVSHISFSTPLKTPHTPYPLRPSDSPSNPFGKKRIQYLIRSLPPATLFSKHLPLRFQFIRRDSSGPRQGGVFRIVQVPLSYTFTHLRCLIAFLFGGLPGQEIADEHLFEVKKKVALYSQMYKPGQVKTGQTWAKLSSSKNPYRYRLDYLNDEDYQELDSSDSEQEDKGQSDDDESESENWNWEDEEEFTVGHVWPNGPDLSRGIVYHHSRTTQIHISVNQTVIPRRKGRSNTPFVFSARGRVWLSPPPLPQPIFSSSDEDESSQNLKRHRYLEDEDEKDAEGDTEEEDEDEEHLEKHDVELDPVSWNEPPDSFGVFLSKSVPKGSGSPSPDFNYDAEWASEGESLVYPSTPGLTRSSSAIPSSPLPASSSPRSSSRTSTRTVCFSEQDTENERSGDEGEYITLSLPALTPFPPRTRPIRKRMERVEKRMGKAKKGKYLCARDEKVEVEEKDELAEEYDDEQDSEDVALAISKAVKKGVKDQKIEEGNMPEDWDPFGEEEEL